MVIPCLVARAQSVNLITSFPATEATQAAAADDRFIYAVSSTAIAKYDRATGRRESLSHGPAHHLNSAAWWNGRLLCAHSNYPTLPEQSEVRALDPATMELTVFHDFGAGHGSLTWVVHEGQSWWCNFAKYGAGNAQTMLVEYSDDWLEKHGWTYPPAVIGKLGKMSISGGLWRDHILFVTGHDRPEIYRLRLPKEGTELEYIDTLPAPFPGQGISLEEKTGALVGIGRANREVILAEVKP